MLCRRNTNFFFFFNSIVMDKRENRKNHEILTCGIRRCCHGCKRDSWKQSPASPGSSWGEAWLPTSSSPSYGSAARRQKVFGGAGEAKTHRSVDTDEREKDLFRETVERDICREERRRGLSASKQTRVKLDCKPDLGTRGPTSRGLGFEGLLPASSCVCRDAHVVCCWCCHLQLLMLPSSIVMMLPIFNCCCFHLPLWWCSLPSSLADDSIFNCDDACFFYLVMMEVSVAWGVWSSGASTVKCGW